MKIKIGQEYLGKRHCWKCKKVFKTKMKYVQILGLVVNEIIGNDTCFECKKAPSPENA